jgi:hypothetical protein
METNEHSKPLWYYMCYHLGASTYSFKYFCVNINGFFSDGKILTFTTNQSKYALTKVSMGFYQPLTYQNTLDFACAISEGLIIPYA